MFNAALIAVARRFQPPSTCNTPPGGCCRSAPFGGNRALMLQTVQGGVQLSPRDVQRVVRDLPDAQQHAIAQDQPVRQQARAVLPAVRLEATALIEESVRLGLPRARSLFKDQRPAAR